LVAGDGKTVGDDLEEWASHIIMNRWLNRPSGRFYALKETFGLIRQTGESKAKVFCAASDYLSEWPPKLQTQVTFDIEDTNKGLRALNVMPVETAIREASSE
jgi:hypothetical protein